MNDRPIRLVLDTTAIAAYCAGSMHVHEPVLMVAEDDGAVAVPLTCLITAVRRDPGIDLGDVLHHDVIEIVQPGRDDADLILDWTLYYDGREDLAAAAVLSSRHEQCMVLTEEPDAYRIAGHRPHWVIPVDGTW